MRRGDDPSAVERLGEVDVAVKCRLGRGQGCREMRGSGCDRERVEQWSGASMKVEEGTKGERMGRTPTRQPLTSRSGVWTNSTRAFDCRGRDRTVLEAIDDRGNEDEREKRLYMKVLTRIEEVSKKRAVNMVQISLLPCK